MPRVMLAEGQSVSRALIEGLLTGLLATWPSWIALSALAMGMIAIGLARRFLRHRRFVRSGIDDIDRFGGETFERYLTFLFRELGYVVERTKLRGDYGGDLVLTKGGERTVVQAKRSKRPVGVKAVQEAVAAKGYYACTEAMVVTNGYVTKQATELARRNDVTLWDRDVLVRHLDSVRASEAHPRAGPGSSDVLHSRPAGDAPAALPAVEACAVCAKLLSPGERAYCARNATRFEGRMLCFRHQRTPRPQHWRS